MEMTATLQHQVEHWMDNDPDCDNRTLLQDLLQGAQTGDAEAVDQLTDAFAAPLTFGTAGLRGPMGPGPARMNRVTVGCAAAGFAQWLASHDPGQDQRNSGSCVIVGYDARHHSATFARDTALILTAHGFTVLLLDEPSPTPLVAFGIGHFGCVAGVVVTASHNPAADNGYKVYLGDGSQIVPPVDTEIEALIRGVDFAAIRPLLDLDDPRVSTIGPELRRAYIDRAATLVEPPATKFSWVHTAMHGVGATLMSDVATAAGFPAPISVAEQQQPDPEFPTVAFPNPEEKGALDLALQLAADHEADVVIANDPDADRCAVAIPTETGWRTLSGDELGILLADDAMRRGAVGTDGRHVYASTVVSSVLLAKMCAGYGVEYQQTLTGFKWIGRVPGLAYGYEEAIGYCTDPVAVPDKDGITAALRVLTVIAQLKTDGQGLQGRLDDIMRRYGLHTTSQLSVRVDDLATIRDAMARLRAHPPQTLLGMPVTVHDLADGGSSTNPDLPPTDGIEITGQRVHVVVRPSGTEPKLKCYLEFIMTRTESVDLAHARTQAAQAIDELRDELSRVLLI